MGKIHKIKRNFKRIDWKDELEKAQKEKGGWAACKAIISKYVYRFIIVNAYWYDDGRIYLSIYGNRYEKLFKKLFHEYLTGIGQSD